MKTNGKTQDGLMAHMVAEGKKPFLNLSSASQDPKPIVKADPLLTLIEDFILDNDMHEFKEYMSAGVVCWYSRNSNLSQNSLEAMEIYHYKMQEFFRELQRIKNLRGMD